MTSPAKAVLFDLGNTLAAYYTREEFPSILERAIANVDAELHRRRIPHADYETALSAAVKENQESADFRVRPLADRLRRVYALEDTGDPELWDLLFRRFLEPIFAVGRCYDDSLPALQGLRAQGYRIALVSNSPWGSPAEFWREEIARLRLDEAIEVAVFCGDVGYRKPAKVIFEFAAAQLGVSPAESVFIGDIPEWDVAGSCAAGMRPILMDRQNRHPDYEAERVQDLWDIAERIQRLD